MDVNSPWYSLYQLMPTPFPYCGESNPHWIHDPMDTWSSLFYVLVSIWIYRKSKAYRSSALGQMYLIPLLISVGSILFHMSFTYIFLMADFFGIFTLNFYCLNLNRLRLSGTQNSSILTQSILFSSIWVLSLLMTFSLKLSSGLTMIPPILVTLWLELRCYKSEKKSSYVNFWPAVFFIITGYIFMLLEGKPWHMGCFGPVLHFHTLWHFFSAVSIVFIFKFYLQFSVTNRF